MTVGKRQVQAVAQYHDNNADVLADKEQENDQIDNGEKQETELTEHLED